MKRVLASHCTVVVCTSELVCNFDNSFAMNDIFGQGVTVSVRYALQELFLAFGEEFFVSNSFLYVRRPATLFPELLDSKIGYKVFLAPVVRF